MSSRLAEVYSTGGLKDAPFQKNKTITNMHIHICCNKFLTNLSRHTFASSYPMYLTTRKWSIITNYFAFFLALRHSSNGGEFKDSASRLANSLVNVR